MKKNSLILIFSILSSFVDTVLGQGSCDPAFTLGTVTYLYCYRVSTVQMSWSDANKECQKFDAFLLQVYDPPTWQDIQLITNTTADTRWWTSLNDMGTPGSWIFGTGAYKHAPFMSVINFLAEPDDTNHHQNCGALNYVGSVSDERCTDKHRYICEYKPPPGKPCQESWMNYTTGCYLFPFGLRDPFSLLTWSAANTKCQTALNGTSDSSIRPHLLFIETNDELTYIRNTLPFVMPTSDIWWIGLTDIANEGQFTWSDNTPVNNILVWAKEPNNLGGQERCAYVNRAGNYGDLNCNNTEKYICQKETLDTGVSVKLGCPGRWTRAGYSCYLLEYQNKKSWQDAKSACQQAGASLLSVDNLDEKTWLEDQNFIFRNGFMFWTGLNKGGTKWLWSDGTTANMSMIHWNTEPNNFKGSEDCATINRKGFLNDCNCLLKRGFICELNVEDSGCPAGWITSNIGDRTNCYYISNYTATFDEAHSKCRQLAFPTSTYLAAFNSAAELALIKNQLKAQPISSVNEWYTGLTDSGHEGFWTFDTTFNPPPDPTILPWGKWPTFVDGDENCVGIILDAQYMNLKCTTKLPYICEKLAAGVSSRASRGINSKFSASSVFVLVMYFLVYGICLHYILHLTYVLSPGYAYL